MAEELAQVQEQVVIDATEQLGSLGEAGNAAFVNGPEINVTMMAICAACCFAMITEGISWFMIYRHKEF